MRKSATADLLRLSGIQTRQRNYLDSGLASYARAPE